MIRVSYGKEVPCEPEDTVLVADILRFSTTVVALLAVGAQSVVVHDMNGCEGSRLSSNIPGIIDLGSNSTGAHTCSMPNSPSIVMDNPGFFEGKTCLLNTTSGGYAVIDAVTKGATDIVAGAFTNISATGEYLKRRNNVLILATEGETSEVMTPTEDYWYAQAIMTIIRRENVELMDYSRKVYDSYGARRFKMGIDHFPHGDLLHSMEVDSFDFVATGKQNNGWVKFNKTYV